MGGFRQPTDKERCIATVVHGPNQGKRCPKYRVKGATVCLGHGALAPQVRAAADRRVQDQKATELAQRTASGLDLTQYADPVAALEFAVGYTHAIAARLAGLVEQIPDDQLAYRGKAGEHLRGEVVAMQRALDSCRGAAVDALKIGLDARRAGVRESTVNMLDRALDNALTASGIGFDGRAKARETFRRNIRIVQGGGEPESA